MPTLEDVNIRLSVKASWSLTLGLYGGPITREVIAENLMRLIEDGGLDTAINSWTIESLETDNGAVIALACGA